VKALYALLLAPAIAHAQPTDDAKAPEPADTAKPVAPEPAKKKSFYIRAGAAFIDPLSSSNPLELADVDGPASLAVQNGPIAGSGATVSSVTVFAMTVGYRLPYLNRRLSVETVLGLPFTVKFQATGTLRDQSIAPMALGIPTGVPPLGPDLGEAKGAPVTATLVYELIDSGVVHPYVGAGPAILFAYDAHVTNAQLTMVSQPEMSIAPAPGLVLHGGVDVKVYDRWYARLDVKFIALMEARAEVKHIQVQTPDIPLFGTVEVGTAKMNVWVNPLIVQAGIGTDF